MNLFLLALFIPLFVIIARNRNSYNSVSRVLWFSFGLGSFAYYVLPLIFPKSTFISDVGSNDLALVYAINLLFLYSFSLGLINVKPVDKPRETQQRISTAILSNLRLYFVLSFVIIVVINVRFSTSVYNTGVDVDKIVIPYKGVLSLASTISEMFFIVIGTELLRKGKRINVVLVLISILTLTIVQMSSLQRLATIRMLLIFSFYVYTEFNKKRILYQSFVVIGLLLVVSSPIFTLLRGIIYLSESNSFTGDFALQQLSSLSLKQRGIDAYIGEGISLLLERVDLIATSTTLLDYLETEDFNTVLFLKSVFFQFIPGFMIELKPYPLSDSGDAFGELSVIAYGIRNGFGKLGSMTVFGGILAFRVGGLLWVGLSGFLAARFTKVLLNITSGMGALGVVLAYNIIFSVTIKKAPMSLSEVLVSSISTFYIIIILKVFAVVWRVFKK